MAATLEKVGGSQGQRRQCRATKGAPLQLVAAAAGDSLVRFIADAAHFMAMAGDSWRIGDRDMMRCSGHPRHGRGHGRSFSSTCEAEDGRPAAREEVCRPATREKGRASAARALGGGGGRARTMGSRCRHPWLWIPLCLPSR
ncbi:Os08g0497750 [Oryza sativa Japonica Group]|uniref:Os08g0497750 protein n=1 Tax=Oryza sativa subsp. japonica TaxID=39947 RepID=A0A0P0XHF2_ORYSJ|nr:Os08g0497750 [Oryza sativa Japonica Group]